MSNYLQRYLDGEYELVWAELTAQGLAIRKEPLYTEALAVARETMTRARANVETLVQRLTALGYQFTSDALGAPPTPHVPPSYESVAAMRALEIEYGALPLSMEAWFEIVGGVDFMGVYPGLSAYQEVNPSNLLMSFQGQVVRMSMFPTPHIVGPATAVDLAGDANLTSDPLVVWPCVEPLVDERDGASEGARYCLGFAPDALTKANTSGGDGPHIDFGDPRMDAPLSGDDWEGAPFVSYLRTVFAWGGFPGLRTASAPSQELLSYLREGLRPL